MRLKQIEEAFQPTGQRQQGTGVARASRGTAAGSAGRVLEPDRSSVSSDLARVSGTSGLLATHWRV